MKKISSYSKYQRDIIKRIGKELGTSIAFNYGKCSNNHLKIYIDGLEKPLYTSSTPSDRKSGDNFMGDLRSALKVAHLKRHPVTTVVKHMNNALLKTQYIESLKSACIKTVRTNIEQYAEKEKLSVMKENSMNSLKPQRKRLATKIFEHTQKAHKNVQYITGKDSQGIKDEIIKHLHYMLPNNGDYAKTLKPEDTENKLNKAVNIANNGIKILSIEAANQGLNKLAKRTEVVTDLVVSDENSVSQKESINSAVELNSTPNNPNINPAETLAAMSKKQAVQNFRRLSRNEGKAMLAYITLAMEQNHQQDLSEISELMAAKGINLDMIADFLNSPVKLVC